MWWMLLMGCASAQSAEIYDYQFRWDMGEERRYKLRLTTTSSVRRFRHTVPGRGVQGLDLVTLDTTVIAACRAVHQTKKGAVTAMCRIENARMLGIPIKGYEDADGPVILDKYRKFLEQRTVEVVFDRRGRMRYADLQVPMELRDNGFGRSEGLYDVLQRECSLMFSGLEFPSEDITTTLAVGDNWKTEGIYAFLVTPSQSTTLGKLKVSVDAVPDGSAQLSLSGTLGRTSSVLTGGVCCPCAHGSWAIRPRRCNRPAS